MLVAPSSLSLANCGLSLSFRRIHTEMPSNRIETRNGMRQPQLANASSPSSGARGEDDEQCGEQPERGRRLDPAGRLTALVVGGVFGDVNRRAAIFAAQCGALCDPQDDEQDRGREYRPVRRSAAGRSRRWRLPIRLTVARKVALRPTRSPIAPKMIAPSGRKAKPTANSASAATSAPVGSSPARNTLAMTGVRLPKMKKSYHSKAVPADDAVMTRAIDHDLAGCDMRNSSPAASYGNRAAIGGR